MTDEQRAELKRLAEKAKRITTSVRVEMSAARPGDALVMAALHDALSPSIVLDLLNEHEEDQGFIRVWRGRCQRAEADNACALEHIRSHIARHEGTPTAARMEAFLAFEHPGANLFSELDALKTENERLKAEVDELQRGIQSLRFSMAQTDGEDT